jgi:hypothetical protein
MSIKKENPKVDFVKNEHEILDYWSKNKTFEKLVEKNSNNLQRDGEKHKREKKNEKSGKNKK